MTRKKSTPVSRSKLTQVNFDLKAYVSTIKSAAPQAAFVVQNFPPRVIPVGAKVTDALVDSAFQTAIFTNKA
ncbi:hypothetical protein [Iningainema tapete]|uniref:Uncharacterized protein n=1 Tax=Iningainema tapete BLCC-T55 TaxID=2748662 RepID=A0A8J6XJJ8_9CYAN|nr:hypothetical protein [Iningainema tapete]MBD2771502.1 hypothetical protein [Iningainema tapete BLCC-T55]